MLFRSIGTGGFGLGYGAMRVRSSMAHTSGMTWFVWFNQINKTNQTNQFDGILGRAACWWSSAPASAIGGPSVETGEADGDGGPFARRAADGNRAAMFLDDLLDRGETQTGAGPLRGEKRLKDLIDDFCRDGSPVVLDEDLIFHAAPCAMLGYNFRWVTKVKYK